MEGRDNGNFLEEEERRRRCRCTQIFNGPSGPSRYGSKYKSPNASFFFMCINVFFGIRKT